MATRAAKVQGIDRDDLRLEWRGEAERAGLSFEQAQINREAATPTPVGRLGGVDKATGTIIAHDGYEAVRKSIAHISEKQMTWTEADLTENALKFSNRATHKDVEWAIGRLKQNGTLLEARDGKEALLTDDASILKEKQLGTYLREASRQKLPVVSTYGERSFESGLRLRMEQSTLSDGQKDAITTALTGTGRYVGIQGYAGTGKTFAMKRMVVEAERAGLKVEGLAPSHEAVKELSDAIPNTETVAARTTRQTSNNKDNDPRKTILVVDEVGMMSRDEMLGLMKQAQDKSVARVVYLGDMQQTDAVSAGTPFASMQKMGMRTAVMDDIIRQEKEVPLSIVKHAIAGEVKEAFAKIGSNVVETKDIALYAAERYLESLQDGSKKTGLATRSNATRLAINEHIRTGLKHTGAIGTEDHRLTVLEAQYLTNVQLSDPNSYQVGDVIVAHASVKSGGVVKGRIYDVDVVEGDKRQVMITDRGTQKTVPLEVNQSGKLAKSIALYTEGEREFSQGDAVKFTISDKKNDIKNGERWQIEAIDGEKMALKNSDGATKTIPNDSLAAQGIDHSYALTIYDMQGATVDKNILVMGSNEALTSQKDFYVGVSRMRDEVVLVTDNAERLSERLEKQTGVQITALDAYLEEAKGRLSEKATPQDKSRDDEIERNAAKVPEQENEAKDGPKNTIKAVENNEREREKTLSDYEAIAQIINKGRDRGYER